MVGRIITRIACLLASVASTNAFSDRAGSCDAGIPLQGSHILNEQLGGGPLSDKGFQVLLNDNALDSESQNDVPVSVEGHELKLVARADSFFRGFLVRIDGEGLDTREYLDAPDGDDNIRVVSLCVVVEDVGGVSHTNNDEKTEATAVLRLPEPANGLAMDVTIVVQNRDGAAEWYNSRFILNAGAVTVAPTISPAPSPKATLSPMPTPSPKPTAQKPSEPESPAPSSVVDTVQPSAPRDLTSGGNSFVASHRILASLVVAITITVLI